MITARDQQLLKQFGMSEQELDDDVALMEDEHADHGIIGPVYYGLHSQQHKEKMRTVTLRLPERIIDHADKAAERYHITRSEYLRRKLEYA